jgi:type II restriction/modification system DNA methylase subunit YeeA
MDEEERRELGAHYTSELNIMKVIQPLFLDELYTEFDTAKRSQQRLETFHNKLASLKFLDPACGCGNFLVTTYRELRKLELEVLKKKRKNEQESLRAFGTEELSRIHVNQFYGIEIEEFPTLVARTAMYLADHQATMMLREAFGMAQPRIPLEEPATIVHANALTTDWKEVVSPDDLDYILGNPPFIGAMIMSTQQRADLKSVFGDVKNTGVLDFVSAWYVKSSKYIQNTKIKVGLVSTNSITQGEQVSILWKHLHEKYGVVRHFAPPSNYPSSRTLNS